MEEALMLIINEWRVIKVIKDMIKICVFHFWGVQYEERKVMGYPLSLIIANLYMGKFKIHALNQNVWKWFNDDKVVFKEEKV